MQSMAPMAPAGMEMYRHSDGTVMPKDGTEPAPVKHSVPPAGEPVSADPRPLLTADSLSSLVSVDVMRPALVEDIARAVSTVARPLSGPEEVSEALASSICSCSAEMREQVVSVLHSSSRRVPGADLCDSVFRVLAKRCLLGSMDDSSGAADSVVAVACRCFDGASALSRVRALVFDVVYMLASMFPERCVAIVGTLWCSWERRSPENCAPSIFPCVGIESAGGFSQLPAHDILLRTVLRSLLVCFRKLGDSRKEIGQDGRSLQDALMGVEKYFLDEVSQKDELADMHKKASSSSSSDDARCSRLALSLETRRVGPVVAYEQLLLPIVWPAVAAAMLDPIAGDSKQTRSVRRGAEADGEVCGAILAVGVVLAALGVESVDARVELGVECVERRLVGLLGCEDVSATIQRAVVHVLICRLQEIVYIEPTNRTGALTTRPRAGASSRHALTKCLRLWHGQTPREEYEKLSCDDRKALSLIFVAT